MKKKTISKGILVILIPLFIADTIYMIYRVFNLGVDFGSIMLYFLRILITMDIIFKSYMTINEKKLKTIQTQALEKISLIILIIFFILSIVYITLDLTGILW